MDIIKLSQLLSTTNIRSYRDDDFWSDRLSHRYSVIIFSVFAVLVTTKAYIGDPIDCWAPPEFKASYERYAETLCFVNGTYYISPTEIDIPSEPGDRYSNRIRYYQWTPFILLLQAFFMYLPRIVWLSLSNKYGINLRNLVDAAKKYESVDSCTHKEKILIYLCKNLLRSIKYREYKRNKKILSSLKKNIYLNHKLELNNLLNLMSTEPKLAQNFKIESEKIRAKVKAKAQKASSKKSRDKFKNSKSDNDLNNNLHGDFYTKLNESDRHTTSKRTHSGSKKSKHKHRSHSKDTMRSQSVTFNNQMMLDPSVRSHHKPAYYIIDPKLNTDQLVDYLNSSLSKNFKLSTPFNFLQSKITNISRKHLLNMLTTGYEINEDEIDINRVDHQTAYLINSNVLKQLDDTLNNRMDTNAVNFDAKKRSCKLLPNLNNKYLSTLYLVIKLFYLISSLSQMFFLNRLIGSNFYMIGIDMIKTFFYEIEWPHLEVFPRMTLCEIYIREVGTVHPYLIQCVLRINLFNEVIFVIVWYWLLFVILMNGLDLIRNFFAIYFSCSNCKRKLFALKYLELIHLNSLLKNRKLKPVNKARLSNQQSSVKETNPPMDNIFVENNHPLSDANADLNQDDANHYDNNMKENELNTKHHSPSSSNVSNVGAGLVVDLNSKCDPYLSHHEPVPPHAHPQTSVDYSNHKFMLIVASEQEEFELFERFCESNFNNDTIFSLRVIEQNVSSLIVSDIIEHLWIQYKILNCVYSTETNDYLLKKLFIYNKNNNRPTAPINENHLEYDNQLENF